MLNWQLLHRLLYYVAHTGVCLSGQKGRTVNPLAYAYAGSNPAAPIRNLPKVIVNPSKMILRIHRCASPMITFYHQRNFLLNFSPDHALDHRQPIYGASSHSNIFNLPIISPV
jgi:hypothetical protein